MPRSAASRALPICVSLLTTAAAYSCGSNEEAGAPDAGQDDGPSPSEGSGTGSSSGSGTSSGGTSSGNGSGGSSSGGSSAGSSGSADAGDSGADSAFPSEGGLIGGRGSVCTQPATIEAGPTAILVDGAGNGRTFDGIGGLSGGGGTSRLLIDYPPQQQNEILDFLFKPQFGASLHILKVEIGGDTNTTNGAEASHERGPTDQNYQRGYEWWLMEQAKKRNPSIKLYGLEWGAPGWFSGGYFSQDNIDYIVNWITHAQSDHGLTIDYIGCRNEMPCTASWLEQLKAALSSHGLSTKVVSNDSVGWGDAATLQSDATYAAAVDIVGSHYPCGYLKDGTTCAATGTATAIALGKPLWASEQGSQRFDTGALPMARNYIRGYLQAKITASINWSLAGAWYTNIPYAGVDGLLEANLPWSGHYVIDREIWTTAHFTQFVQPGWQFVDSGSALVTGVGSYVVLRAPNGEDWTAVIETTDATTSTTFRIAETGGVFAGPVHVWATNLASTTPSDWFVPQPDIIPSGCELSLTAAPNSLYTLSTTSGQSKGTSNPPPAGTMALPYSDDFESYTVGAMPNLPKYLSAMEGAFEAEHCAGGRSGTCVQQEVGTAPLTWKNKAVNDPLAVLGDPGWTDYTISVDSLLQHSGTVDLIGRIKSVIRGVGVQGYHLRISDTGAWSLFREDSATATTPLASGTASFPLDSWHTLSLAFSGSHISAAIDGKAVGSATDATYPSGNVGISASKWNDAQFDNLHAMP
jgi:hypothetical protein